MYKNESKSRLTLLGLWLLALFSMKLVDGNAVQAQGDKPVTKQSSGLVGLGVHHSEQMLRRYGFEATPEGLKQALSSSSMWARVFASRVVKERKAKELAGEVEKSLDHERAAVRVEAAIALVSLDDSKGVSALRDEVGRASQTQQKLLGNRGQIGTWTLSDLEWGMDACGALAELGDSRGFDLVKSTLLQLNTLPCATDAACVLPKFARFKDKRIDVLPTLLQAEDDVIKLIDDHIAKDPAKDDPGPKIAHFNAVARALWQVGGEEAAAKLKKAAQHSNKRVRACAVAYLHAIDRDTRPPKQKSQDSGKGKAALASD